MAAILYPKAQAGGFTGLPNINYTSVQVLVNNRVVDVTGSNAAGTADLVRKYCFGLNTVDVIGQGTLRAGGLCSKSQLGSVDPGDFKFTPQQVSIVRTWPLIDVTGSPEGVPDTEKGWSWGISTMGGNVRGNTVLTGPIYDDEDTTLTIAINQVGSFAFTAAIRNTNTGVPFNRGGPIPFSFNYLVNGPWVLTPTDDNFTSTFGSTAYDPVKEDITVDLDTGETITHAALLYSIALSQDMAAGGPVFATVKWRFDQADAEV